MWRATVSPLVWLISGSSTARYLLVAIVIGLAQPDAAGGGWTQDDGDFSIDVTYRQVEDGRSSTAVFMLSLVCIGNTCKREILSLNQCFQNLGQRPKNEVSFNVATPWYGKPTLTVTRSENVILATERIPGGAFSFRFVITPSARQPNGLRHIDSIEFSGSLDKYSDILKCQTSTALVRVRSGNVPAACQFNLT